MFHGKPILGVVGGIGSGKSHVARLFGELGCLVIDSDAQVREAYADRQILDTLRAWWGDEVFRPDGTLDRANVAKKVFGDAEERRRLEQLVHPWVDARRWEVMSRAPADVPAFVWDTPLLFEAGLNRQCDRVVFVDAPLGERLRRVREQRGWDEAELLRREKLQMPLDTKREISDIVLVNGSDADDARSQVRQILSRMVEGLPARPREG